MEQMIRNFSKGSFHYDAEASVQEISAKNLGEFLKKQTGKIIEGPLLEIGSGTGFVTKEILDCFPERSFTATDICQAMLDKNRDKYEGKKNLKLSLLDGEVFCEKDQYALIVSGLAFHWFSHFTKSISQIYEGLKPGGVLLFSFVEAKSFPEWKEVCLDLQLPYTGNHFPDLREVSSSHFWEENITITYPNALECLKSFKRIGTGTSLKNEHLNPSQMKRLLKNWDERSPQGVDLTYNIVTSVMEK